VQVDIRQQPVDPDDCACSRPRLSGEVFTQTLTVAVWEAHPSSGEAAMI
jgi:hypothetical protein